MNIEVFLLRFTTAKPVLFFFPTLVALWKTDVEIHATTVVTLIIINNTAINL